MADDKKGYCLSCGMQVELFYMLVDGKDRPHCFLCGTPIEEAKTTIAPARIKTLDLIMIADDSALAREVMVDKLVELNAAKKVIALANGEEFIESFTRKLIEKSPPQMVILDIRMPGINGVNAGLAARCIEKAFGKPNPTPLMFFSSVLCDDTLKAAMTRLSPARYINKGASATPDDLATRIVGVISKLLAGK